MKFKIKIVGDGGELLPIRTPCEICIKGFGVFSGYLYNESENFPVDNNGWLHTGYKFSLSLSLSC